MYFVLNHLWGFLVRKCLLTFVSLGFCRSGREGDRLGCIYPQQGEHMKVVCVNMEYQQKNGHIRTFLHRCINSNWKKGKLGKQLALSIFSLSFSTWGSVLSGCPEVLVLLAPVLSRDGGWAGRRRHAPLRVRPQQAAWKYALKDYPSICRLPWLSSVWVHFKWLQGSCLALMVLDAADTTALKIIPGLTRRIQRRWRVCVLGELFGSPKEETGNLAICPLCFFILRGPSGTWSAAAVHMDPGVCLRSFRLRSGLWVSSRH